MLDWELSCVNRVGEFEELGTLFRLSWELCSGIELGDEINTLL